MIGHIISHYHILDTLGAGAMGVVYLAEDTTLNYRQVALKVLKAEVASDPECVRRFKQEATAASALNHPNILTIYEIGQFEGAHFIASEYVKGKTLRCLLTRGKMGLMQALDVAEQVASALSAAHEAGIVHRDPKPENIMLREDGVVKVLDFGLAKLTRGKIGPEEDTLQQTSPGLLLGTLAYMSPEQVEGKEIDGRSDEWSAGACLYEMLTGQPPFAGMTCGALIAAILRDEYAPLDERMPDELCRIVERTLEKNPDERHQDTKDFLLALKKLRRRLELEQENTRRSRSRALVGGTGQFGVKQVVGVIKRHKLAVEIVLAVALLLFAAGLRLRHFGVGVNNPVSQQSERHSDGQFPKSHGVPLQPKPTTHAPSPEARQHYEMGMKFWSMRTGDSLQEAIKQFQQATTNDPNYELAFVGLASCYVLLEEYLGTPSTRSLPVAEFYVREALKLNSELPEAYATLGFIKTKRWEWKEAEEAFLKAIELKPDYATARHWYSLFLRIVGRVDESFAQIKRAYEIEPSSLIINANLAFTYLLKDDPESAAEQCRKIIKLDNGIGIGHTWMGLALLELDRKDEALAALITGAESSKKSVSLLANLGYGFARLGNRKEALKIIKELEQRYMKREARGQDLAKVYAGLGDKERAFDWLEKDFDARSGDLPHLNWHPAFKSLRGHPRFTELLQRMSLQPRVNLQIASNVLPGGWYQHHPPGG